MSVINSRRGRLAATVAALSLGVTPLALSGGANAAPAPDGARVVGSSPSDSAASARKAKKHKKALKMTLLAINDFHGQLEVVPPSSSSGRVNDTPAGGSAYLARHLQQLRKEARARGSKSLTVAAGDLVGATPLISAAFYDEPTIEAMNLMKLDMVSVGNHEFDAGWKNLLRLQNGGCVKYPDRVDNKATCADGGFAGADFDYLAANVKSAETGKPILAPYKIVKYGKKKHQVKIGFIGMTLEDTPNIVTKAGVEGLEFQDEIETVRELMPVMRKKGVKSIVVLLHEGGRPVDASQYNGCDNVTGPGRDIAEQLPAAVDMVISGHTHQAYNCTVTDPQGEPRLFTSAGHVGRLVTELNFKVDRRTKDVIRPAAKAENHIVTNSDGTTQHAGVAALVAKYQELVAPIANRVIGQLDGVDQLPQDRGAPEDTQIGNLIADAQLNDDSVAPEGRATPVIAFMNPGGIRTPLVANEAGDITYGAAFGVQPFSNYVVSMDLTGQQILDVLNEQWNGKNETARKILQVAGLSYTYDKSLADEVGTDAVVADSVLVDLDRDGTPEAALDPTQTYRVVANYFLADSGDGFATFGEATDKFVGGVDVDAFAEYLTANSPYSPPATDRITVVD